MLLLPNPMKAEEQEASHGLDSVQGAVESLGSWQENRAFPDRGWGLLRHAGHCADCALGHRNGEAVGTDKVCAVRLNEFSWMDKLVASQLPGPQHNSGFRLVAYSL